jgi:hypothetical protein
VEGEIGITYPAKQAHIPHTLIKEIEDGVTAPSFDKVMFTP